MTEARTGDRPSMVGHPGRFGGVMATAPVALAAGHQTADWSADWLNAVAVAFLLLASVIAVWLLPGYVRRARNLGDLAEEMADPARGPMLATFPAGVLLLAAAWGQVGRVIVPVPVALWIDAVLLTAGAVVAVAVGVAWADSVRNGQRELSAVNGAWLIPAVMNMIVPLGVVPLVLANRSLAGGLLFLGYMFFGVGVLLWLSVFPVLIARLALRPALPAELAPTMWVPLAPAGLVGLVLVRLTGATVAVGEATRDLQTVAVVVAAMGIGFAAWWAVFAATDLVRARRAGPVPFHPGWWGFVFPVAAVSLSVMSVGAATGILPIRVAGSILFVVLLGLWSMVAVRAVRALRAERSGG